MALVDCASIFDGLMLSPVSNASHRFYVRSFRWSSVYDEVGHDKGLFSGTCCPEHVHLTGFVTSQEHWQWRYMAFGLRNAPATFSRLVDKIFKGLEDYCEAYLDDVMVFSRS